MTSVPNPQLRLSGNNQLRFITLLVMMMIVVACGGGNDGSSTNPETTAASTELADIVELRVVVGRATAFDLPDRAANEVFTLVEGDRVEAAGRSEVDALGTVFYVVRFADLSGWIAETQVEVVSGNPDDLLLVPNDAFSLSAPQETSLAQARTAEGPATASFAVVAMARADGAPVYTTYDRSADVLVRLDTGTELEILAHSTPDQDGIIWYLVRTSLADRAWVTDLDFDAVGNLATRQQFVLATATPTADPVRESATPTSTATSITATESTSVTADSVQLTSTPSPTITPVVPAALASATTTPTLSRTPRMSATPAPTVTPRSIRLAAPPPLVIDLPAGWEQEHAVVPIESALGPTDIMLSIYEGPLSGGATGRITVLWQFTIVAPLSGELSLWPNAVLYLRSLLYRDCTVADHAELRRTEVIGGREAVGSILQVINCLDGSPDLAGWFAATNADGENYVFYMTVEPDDRVRELQPELRQIVDSLRFISPDE